jgi:hypothetical protein
MRKSILFVLLITAGCGAGTVADFTGNYTITVTDETNGCGFQNWTQGSSTTGIGFTVTQSSNMITGDLTGVGGSYADLVLGSHEFKGSGSGTTATLTLYGTRSTTMAGCAYTINATVIATLNGDAITGTIDYASATNNSPDCGSIQGCHSTQAFNGTRPPK